MANRNSGGWQRFENGAIVLIGSDPILNIVPGSVRVRHRQRERVGNRDRGVLGGMTVGDQRPQEIELQVWRTTTLNALLALMVPAATNGMETFFAITIKQPAYLGATTGDQWVFSSCYLPEGWEDAAGGAGEDADKCTIRMVHYGDIVTPTTY